MTNLPMLPTDQVLNDRNVEAFSKRVLGSSLALRTDDAFDVVGATIAGDADEAAVRHLRASLEPLVRPCGQSFAISQLTRLRLLSLSTSHGDDRDMDARQKFTAEYLAEYPRDVVVIFCRDWPRTQRFFPLPEDITRVCDDRMRLRRALMGACERWKQALPEPTRSETPITDADRGKVHELVQGFTHGRKPKPAIRAEHGGPPKNPDQVAADLAEYKRRFDAWKEPDEGGAA